MRRYLPPLAALSMLCVALPLHAQVAPEAGDVVLQRRAAALNDRIDVAVRERRLSQTEAARLRVEVGRVQTAAGNTRTRNGAIGPGELEQYNRQLSTIEAGVPPTGRARGTRAHDVQATTDMRSRLAAAIDRVRVAEQHHAITPARSAALRRQLADARRDLIRRSGRQGVVGAADLTRYGRLADAADAELSAGASRRSYGNDALPSAEVTAFQRADARLRYRDARIGRDANGCALYEGRAPDGRMRSEALFDAAGDPICPR